MIRRRGEPLKKIDWLGCRKYRFHMHSVFRPVTLLHSEEEISDWLLNNQSLLGHNYVWAVQRFWKNTDLVVERPEFDFSYIGLTLEDGETSDRFFYGTLLMAYPSPTRIDSGLLFTAFEASPITLLTIENFTHRAGINLIKFRARLLRKRFHRLNAIWMLSRQ